MTFKPQAGPPKGDKITASELGQELLYMFDEDQAMRMSGAWDAEVDQRNTARMKEVVEAFGWPIISKFGERVVHAAWLLVQHADADPVFQEEVLSLMKALPDGEVLKQDIAYLEDRVRVNTGRPTLYGTQFYNDDRGAFGPRPIENPKTLDERRTAMGLGLFAEYDKEIRGVDKKRQEQMQKSEDK